MNTPTTRDFLRRPDATRRRSARQALAVIPSVTSSPLSPGDGLSVEVTAMDNFLNSQNGSDSWSPAPSPDELVIQRRGRRRRTIVWSPDLDACKRNSLLSLSSKDRTPVKSPSKSSMVLRSTPRKRLILGDSHESPFTTPEKRKKPHSNANGTSTLQQRQFSGNLINALLGLSHNQLVHMIMDLVSLQEDGVLSEGDNIRSILLKKMPLADIQPLIDKLNDLRENVYASLVSSTSDGSAYSRTYIYLDAFQKAILEQGKRLLDSQHWVSLMEYICTAWKITRDLPSWENPSLSNCTKKCLKSLTQLCIQALKKGTFENSELNRFSDRIESMLADCEDMKICLVLLDDAKQNAI